LEVGGALRFRLEARPKAGIMEWWTEPPRHEGTKKSK